MNYKKFEIIYYLTLYSPTFDKTQEMIKKYVEHGASAIQLDIPAYDPKFETEFVQKCMKTALSKNPEYSIFLENIHVIRQEYPLLSIHIVVYPEVITSIGFQEFVDFVLKENITSVMIAGGDKNVLTALSDCKIPIIRRIDRALNDGELKEYSNHTSDTRYNFNYKRHSEITTHGLSTFKDKISYIRKAGVKGSIYAVEGVSDVSKIQEVYKSGANGVLIGNALMNKWSNEEELWLLFNMFQSFSK